MLASCLGGPEAELQIVGIHGSFRQQVPLATSLRGCFGASLAPAGTTPL